MPTACEQALNCLRKRRLTVPAEPISQQLHLMQPGDSLEMSRPEQCVHSTLAERPSQPSRRARRRARNRKAQATDPTAMTATPAVEMHKSDDAECGSTTAESEQEGNPLLESTDDQSSEAATIEAEEFPEEDQAEAAAAEEEFPEAAAAPQTASEKVKAEQTLQVTSGPDDISLQREQADEQLVYGLAKLLEQMARTSKTPVKKSGFQSVRVPNISLSSYASRIHEYFRCTGECFVLCLIYIDRIVKHNTDIQVTDLTCHRMLLTGCAVAAKVHDDEYASNEYFARVGGIETQELNTLEVEFLQLLGWKLFVSGEEYDWFLQALRRIP